MNGAVISSKLYSVVFLQIGSNFKVRGFLRMTTSVKAMMPGLNLVLHRNPMTTSVKAMMPGKLRMKTTSVKAAPWLLVPAVVEGGDMVYKFYTTSGEEEASSKMMRLKNRKDGDEVPPDKAKLVGSSHGWVASFDDDTNHVFLSNPISGHHIKLPPVSTLPDPEINLLDGRGSVSRLLLTCSPDRGKDHCRAVIIYGPLNRLAYCVPGASTDWTPIGKPYFWTHHQNYGDNVLYKCERPYMDFVYSDSQKLLFCIMERLNEFEGWNLTDPLHPKKDWSFSVVDDLSSPMYDRRPDLSYSLMYPRLAVGDWAPQNPWPQIRMEDWDPDHIKHRCWHLHYLVLARHSDELFHVVRHVAPRLRPDGSTAWRVFFSGKFYPHWDYKYPYKTVYFDVYKLDRARQELTYMDEGSLEGLAMFVGMSGSFVLPAADYPHLKPDSIYFTDEDSLLTPSWTNFGGHDNGVFDYRAKAFSSWCDSYPNDYDRIRRIVPPPMWYTP